MSKSHDVIDTAYGLLDRRTLEQVKENYDTSSLLRIVDELDRVLVDTRGTDGLRDMLLRMHGMAHSIINGAGMTVSTNEDSLPELAADVIADMQRTIQQLQEWIKRIEPLEELSPRS